MKTTLNEANSLPETISLCAAPIHVFLQLNVQKDFPVLLKKELQHRNESRM